MNVAQSTLVHLASGYQVRVTIRALWHAWICHGCWATLVRWQCYYMLGCGADGKEWTAWRHISCDGATLWTHLGMTNV